MGATLKAKLSQVEDDLEQLRNDRAAKARTRDEAKAAFAAADGYDINSDEYKRAADAIKEVSAADEKIVELQETQVGILKMLGNSDPAATVRKAEQVAAAVDRWDPNAVITAEVMKSLEAISGSTGRFGAKSLGQIASRDAMKAELGTTAVAGLIQNDTRGLLPYLYRQLRLLDLIPAGTTDSNTIEYVKVTALGSASAETAEGAAKPEHTYTFADATAPIRTIAGWVKVRKQTLADAAALRTFLDTALKYDVRRRLEANVANGDGTGQNIRGILQTSGVGTPTVTTGESHADRLHHGIVAVELAEQEPNFVGLHPKDAEKYRLSRENGTSGGYLTGGPAEVGATTMWGLPIVKSTAIPEGTGLVGDSNASIVMVREGVNVLISDSDQDDFIKNRVTLLGEMRAGLVVHRPDGFAKVNLGVVS